MAEPTPPHSVAAPLRAATWHRTLAALASLALVLQVALGLRMIAADSVDLYVHREGPARLCLFPDTTIYWGLARTIRTGTAYEYVEWNDIPSTLPPLLRTPGYPLFLSGCQAIFGLRTLAVRLVQAGLGTLSVYLIYRSSDATTGRLPLGYASSGEPPSPCAWLVRRPLFAAALAGRINPHYLYMTVPAILSEAVFVPLMLAALCRDWRVLWVPVPDADRRSS